MREVSDSLHLRRFCRIALSDRVPDESTVRKLVRRLGPEVVEEICWRSSRAATTGAPSGASWCGRRGSTRRSWRPTSATRPISGWRRTRRGCSRARPPRPASWPAPDAPKVRDRSRAIGGRLRKLNRTLAARTGQGKAAGAAADRRGRRAARASFREARRLAARLREARARPWRSGQARARPSGMDELADRAEKVCEQITPASRRPEDHRPAGLHQPTPTPGRSARASCDQPTEFGYVMQIAELCENTRRGARGLILPGRPADRLPQRVRAAARDRRPARANSICARASSRSTAASSPAPSTSTCPTRPAVHRRPPSAGSRRPTAAWRSSASAPKAASATSNAATASPHPPQRPRRRPHLGRLGDPRLQPRHARHPNRLTRSPKADLTARAPPERTAAPSARGAAVPLPRPFIRGK